MNLVKNENYIHIEGWMINELHLKGNDLLVYAIIYGFSQDNESRYTGSLQYLADWCNGTKQGIQKNLSNLLKKGYIKKFESVKNNIKYCEYSCIPYNLVVYPMQLSCTNNIDNNIDNTNIISKDIILPKNQTNYSNDEGVQDMKSLVSNFEKPKEEKKKKDNLFTKCLKISRDFSNNEKVISKLIEYYNYRLEKHKNSLANGNKSIFYSTSFKSAIYGTTTKSDDCISLVDYSDDDKIKIIQQTIDNGWIYFYPLVNYKSKYKSSVRVIEDTKISSQSVDNAYLDKQKTFREELAKSGRQTSF